MMNSRTNDGKLENEISVDDKMRNMSARFKIAKRPLRKSFAPQSSKI